MGYIIYKITNKINQKAYIGFTSKTLKERWRRHCINAKYGRKSFLYNALRKYGKDAFDLEILYQTYNLEEARDSAENKFITLYETMIPEKGYNMTRGGEGTIGHKHSAESISKMSNSHKGKKHTLETKRKLSDQRKGAGNPNYGKIFDQEYRDKISRATKGALNPRSKNTWSRTQTETYSKLMTAELFVMSTISITVQWPPLQEGTARIVVIH